MLALVAAVAVAAWVPAWWCGRDAAGWYRGDPALQRALAEELIWFEAHDDRARADPSGDRFAGEWALVTHQMVALGLAQLCLAHPDWRPGLAPEVTRAAVKSWRPEMRDFGTAAWNGEDALASLDGPHGHAYLAYAALAVGMARLLDPSFPAEIARQHDALIAAYVRRLRAAPTALIETYPGEAYPTDVAAVAAAIAVHGRATGADHGAVLAWLTPTQGLVSPDGAVAPPLLVLGAAVIGMRVVVLAFVPGLLTFRLVRWAATRLRDRSVGGGPVATAATRPGD